MQNNITKTKYNVLPYALLAVFCIGIMLAFAYNTSPLINYIGKDSGIFLVMGRALAQGKTLYVDVFDHKGPLIFLLNMLPQLLIKGTLGVWLMELGLMIASALLLYRLANRHIAPPLAMIVSIVYIWITVTFFNGGNYTEEYTNFFSVLSFCMADTWITDRTLSKKQAFLFGVCIAFVFFLRPNNMALIAAAVLFIGVDMLRIDRRRLPSTLLFGFLGLAAVTLPLVIWHLSTGTLYDMIYATILHNLLYCAATNAGLLFIPNGNAAQLLCWGIALLLIVDAICTCYSAVSIRTANFLLLSLVVLVAAILISGHPFMYYWTMAAPLSAYSAMTIIKCRKAKKRKLVPIGAVTAVITLAVSVNALLAVNPLEKKSTMADYRSQAGELLATIPENERSECFCYDMPAFLIYEQNLPTPCRYFTMQTWMSDTNPDIAAVCAAYVREKKPTWILSYYQNANVNKDLHNCILSDYTPVVQNDYGYLYRRQSD